MRDHRQGGFTIIELMIVVVLVGVLAAIAVPSYSAYVVRGQRSAAKAALLQAAQQLERNYTLYGCYNYTALASNCSGQTGTAMTLATANAPTDGGTFTYAMTVAFASAQQFTLTATPCGEAGSCPAGTSNQGFADPDCGFLTLDNTGLKAAEVTAATATCWQK
jgi:type IV pilus assembly protein PilE